MTEQFANFARSVLDGGIDGDDTSLEVQDASDFSPEETFRIIVQDGENDDSNLEIMIVTAVAGNVFTVTRGAEGTSGLPHGDGSFVKQVVTAGALEALSQGGGFIEAFTPPVDGDFTWINQGGAAVNTTNGGIYLTAPSGAADTLRIRKQAAPSAPYTITAAMLPFFFGDNTNAPYMGLGWRQSSDGKLTFIGLQFNGGTGQWMSQIVVYKFNSPTSFAAEYLHAGVACPAPIPWFRIEDDNANRLCYYSPDGKDFILVHSVGRTDFLTGDEVFYAVTSSASYPAAVRLLSWV